MTHYDCSYCGTFGCFGDCPEGVQARERIVAENLEKKLSDSVPTAVVPEPSKPAPESPVKSDGGSSDYYRLTVRNKKGETLECETGDIIRALVNNDFDLGNIVKACRRISEAQQGRGKDGISIEYDANKIIYFAGEIKHHAIR